MKQEMNYKKLAEVLRGFGIDVENDEECFMDAVISAANMLHYARVSADTGK